MDGLPVILVVEDNQDNRELISVQLEILNFSWICAKEGMQGIYLAQTQEPNLILLDIMLPDMDGSEVINCLKQNPKTARIPIIAVTALAREQDRDRILQAGADDYITKPYDLYKLEDVIRRHLIEANAPFSLLE